MRDTLDADEARRIVLRAQGVLGKPPPHVQGLLRRLGAVQLDTISVLARSHELVAYARLGAVRRKTVEAAYWGGAPAKAFEYLAHAACILPIESWPYFAFRRRADRHRRHELPQAAVEEVRARLRDGPVTASELGGARSGPGGWWNWSEAKVVIEILWRRGEVVCTDRQNWKRVYDLPERVIPAELLSHEPSDDECFDYLVGRTVDGLGIATKADLLEYFRPATGYLGSPAGGRKLLDRSIERMGLCPVRVEGWADIAYWDPATPIPGVRSQSRTVLLSPFDSLLFDRARAERIFGLVLRIEAYTPAADRVHGYFSMPLLANGRIVGRVDPARQGRTLIAKRLSLEGPAAVEPMAAALREAASWVGCEAVRVDAVEPAALAADLRRALTED